MRLAMGFFYHIDDRCLSRMTVIGTATADRISCENVRLIDWQVWLYVSFIFGKIHYTCLLASCSGARIYWAWKIFTRHYFGTLSKSGVTTIIVVSQLGQHLFGSRFVQALTALQKNQVTNCLGGVQTNDSWASLLRHKWAAGSRATRLPKRG